MPYLKVYRNLHTQRWSVKNSKTGLVVDSITNFQANEVRFKVSKSGNARVRKEKRKNVHAYLCTENLQSFDADYNKDLNPAEYIQISYDPYLSDQFYIKIYDQNIFIDQKWIFPVVHSQGQKLFVYRRMVFDLLKEKGVEFSPMRLFFDSQWKTNSETMKDFLKALLENKGNLINKELIFSKDTGSSYFFDHNQGLCELLDECLGGHTKINFRLIFWLKCQFKHWEHFSGNIEFPVKSNHPDISSAVAYQKLDLYKGEYSKKRFELAQYLLNQLESDI